MMQLGMDGVFVGSGIFKSGDPSKRARAIVQVHFAAPTDACINQHTMLPQFVTTRPSQAVTHYKDPKVVAEVSCNLGEAMVGIDCRTKDFLSMANRSE